MSAFPDDLAIGQLVRAEKSIGRVTAISADGATVTIRTPHGDDWPVPRSEIVRPALSRDRALAILDRLAVPGAHDAPLPGAPEARALVDRMLRTRELPEDERYAAWKPIRAELDAWLRARAPEDLVDDLRHALAARLVPRTADERALAVAILHDEAHALFRELAVATGISLVEITYGVAWGHRAVAPLALTGHAYLGSFSTKGPLVVCDFCYLGAAEGILREKVQGRPGRYHAWVSWSPESPSRTHGLLVAHESALELIALPTRKVGAVANDAGMVGVFDAEAAKEGRLQGWLRRQASDGARVLGITDGLGAIADTDGDGCWDVRALHQDQTAVVIRVALHGDATGKEPIVVAAAAGPAADARTYAPKDRFTAGETIVHPKFGTGRVLSASKDNVEVAFADSVRKLVHGR